MDIEDIKVLIKESLATQIDKEISKRKLPPRTFSDFFQLTENFFQDKEVEFEKIYAFWESSSLDVRGITSKKELISEWNDSIEYHSDNLGLSEESKLQLLKILRRKTI